MQTLTGYTIATTYATTVPVPTLDAATGKYVPGNVYSNGQPAILGNTALPWPTMATLEKSLTQEL